MEINKVFDAAGNEITITKPKNCPICDKSMFKTIKVSRKGDYEVEKVKEDKTHSKCFSLKRKIDQLNEKLTRYETELYILKSI